MGSHCPWEAVPPDGLDVQMKCTEWLLLLSRQHASFTPELRTYLQSPHLGSWLPVLRMTQSPGIMHSPLRLRSAGSELLKKRGEPLGRGRQCSRCN